jgi:putative two-component system response regulator
MVSEKLLSSARILIVDDDPSILRVCESILHNEGYSQIRTMPDSRGVLAAFVEFDPDLLVLDISMPHVDGLQLLSILQSAAHHELTLPVLVITALYTADNRFAALQRGAVEILAKPFDLQEFTLRIRNLLRIRMKARMMQFEKNALETELTNRTLELSNYQLELKEAQLEVIARLARAGEQHDDDTGQHTQRVALAAALLAQEIGLKPEESEIIQLAAPLHDVGKIGVPDSILLKAGKLTEDEHHQMQRHCKIGFSFCRVDAQRLFKSLNASRTRITKNGTVKGIPMVLRAKRFPSKAVSSLSPMSLMRSPTNGLISELGR